jgi:PAS domain S-box-containing protein
MSGRTDGRANEPPVHGRSGERDAFTPELLQAVIAHAPTGILLSGLDGRYLYLNPAAARMTGEPPAAIAGLTKHALMPPAMMAILDGMETRLRAGEPRVREVVPMPRPEGEIRFLVEKVLVGTLGPGGRDDRVVCTYVHNLRSLADLERALGRTEGILEDLVTRSPTAIIALDLENPDNLLYVSANVERLVGYAVGDPPFGLEWMLAQVHPDDQAAATAYLGAMREDRARSHGCTFRFRHADGEYRWIRARSQPVDDQAEVPQAVVVFLADTTEWVRADEEHRRLTARIRRSERIESLGQLAGGLAHDFNNLLGVIANHLQVVESALRRHATQDTVLDPDATEALVADLARIDHARDAAAQLTRQLLAFGPRDPARPTVFDLNDALLEVQEILARAAGRAVRMAVELAPEPLLVRAEPGRLQQMLLNLVVNAGQAMPDGGALALRTRLVHVDAAGDAPGLVAEGDHVELTVTDDGVGMSPEVCAQAFEPFFTTKGGQGTGLGLATVLAVATECGGDVELASEPGAGTTVRVLLPVAAD